jgi:hypothetical protein
MLVVTASWKERRAGLWIPALLDRATVGCGHPGQLLAPKHRQGTAHGIAMVGHRRHSRRMVAREADSDE